MAKSPADMAASMVDNLEEKTGKPLPAWLQLVSASGLKKHGQIVKLLKADHGVTHGFANLIAHKALEASKPAQTPVDLVENQYSGPKSGLRPIYDSLIKRIEAFGPDVEISPKKAYVSLRRKKQFALIQPSTKTRVDVGINLKGRDPVGRLEASGSFNAMVSHRVKLTDLDQVDEQLMGWLKAAYDLS